MLGKHSTSSSYVRKNLFCLEEEKGELGSVMFVVLLFWSTSILYLYIHYVFDDAFVERFGFGRKPIIVQISFHLN